MIQDRFREIRKKLGLTQTEMGIVLEKKLRSIQYYESSDSNITLDVVIALQKKFNVNPNFLITGEGSMFLNNEKKDNKYQWLINTLDRLPESEVKRIENEAQKLLEAQYNQRVIKNPSENVG